ncbi:MAG: N-acetyltransferase [Desulfobacterota bacterium]|nr:N-acetyltransferase [Thermodesulfobacteriota bacterium]
MAGSELKIEEVKTRSDLAAFLRFPWKIYRGNPFWVPPLIKDQQKKLSPSSPFRSHAEMVLYLARRDGEVVGRVAGIVDRFHIEYHQERAGFFGFFESIEDPEVGRLLLSSVETWAKERGMEKILGPMNPSMNDECGLLVDAFDRPPALMMPYNPPYYSSLIEGCGYRKVMDLYAYLLEKETFQKDRLERITERILKKEPDLSIRPLNMGRFKEDLKIIKEIYNDIWSRNWGFTPMTEEEIDEMAKAMKPLVVPELVLFAYVSGEPVGFSAALPDYNVVLKHLNGRLGPLGLIKFLYFKRKIRLVRIMLLGIKQAFQKRGIEGLLYIETFKRGIAKGYHQGECSWILENNLLMRHGIEAMGGKRYKTYRIYEKGI